MTKKEKVWRSGSAGKMYPGRAQRLKDEKEETAAVADAAGDKEDKVVKKGKKTKQKQGEDEKQKVKEEQKEEEEKLKEQKDSAAVIVLKGVSSKGMKRGKEVKGAKGTKEVKEEKEKVDTAQQTEEDKEDYAWVKAKKKAKKLKKDKKEKGKKGETGKKGKKEKKVEKEEKKKKRSKREKKPKEEEGGKEQVEVLESKILEEKGTELGKELASEASVPSVVEIPLITPQQIERELAERHAMERERVSLECLCRYRCRCPVHKWPVVSKVNIRTRHWEPPGRPQRPPKVIIKLPKLNLQPWIPPSELPRKPRSKTPRLLPEPPLPLLPCAKLKKAWHRFVQVEPNKMMLQGTIACNSKRYQPSFRGAQTACVAAVCRALLEETPPARLQRRDVDDVINAADYYYRICLKLNKCYKGPHQLELCQLVRGVFFRDWFYKFDLEKAEGGVLARLPVCSTDHKPPGKPPLDLFEIMEKFQGKEYMYILTVGRTKHFLIWGHPPEPEAGSNVKTVCYIFDPYMLDEAGTRNYCHGAGAILRYPGVTSFVVDFLTNHGHIDRSKDQCDIANTPITLTAMDILTKEPVPRAPCYSLELRALKPHCYGEREALYNNVMLDEKLYKHKWNIASLSAESVAISRRSSRWRVKLALGLVDDGKRPVPSDPRILPVPPEEPPPRITLADVLKYQGEDFFLFCPIRTDSHLYGRDDMIPYARSETVLHSHALLSQQANTSQFSQISDGKWILRGTRHFASYRYKAFKWYTGVACCVAALAALRRLRARSWNEDTVDETFDVGYNLLRESLLQRHGPIRSLVLGELASIFKMRDREYKFKKRNIVVWGQLISSNPKIYHLCRGIRKFFKEYDTGILQVPGVFETAIWYENKRYYIYHPWPADRFGNRVTLYEGGRGCLLSFSDMEALCDHFLENTREIKRKPYCISDVSVWDLGQRPEPINSMKAVGPNRWIVRGSFHEGSERFKPGHRNNQATPICITAIAMSTLIDPAEWTSNDIDETLIRGDFLYEKSMETLYAMGVHMEQPGEEEAAADEVAGEHGVSAANVADEADVGVTGTIAAADVLTRFNISEADNIETDIQDSLYSGVLLPEPGSGLMSLKEALSALFAEHRAAVVTARDGSMAVWKHEDQYYFFDPHGCDENGLPTDDVLAKACLLRMSENVKELADVIMGNLTPGADDSFNVSPVDIIATKIDPATGAPEISREGKAFEWLNKNTATILMGPRREHTALGEAVTKCFIPKEDMAGRTLALPVVAAFCAATEAVPPPGMHREHMFNFLEAGGDYYRNHVKKTGRHDVTPEDLGEFFEMGVNTFSIEVGEPTELPLRQPDPVEITGEGGGGEEEEAGGEEEEEIKHEEENKDQMNEMKQLLYKMWFDNTKPTTVSLLLGDYHQLGVWMAAGGKVVAFDPAPTLAMGQLIRPRIVKGDELRLERLRAMLPEVVGEEIEGEGEEGGEGEQKPEPEPEVLFVPDDACPVLMWFNSPGEFIDKLVSKGGLDPQQAVAPYQLYPVTVITELTGSVQPKKPKPKRRSESALAEGEDAPEPEPEIPVVAPPLPDPLLDEALGKYFERKTRTTASLRGAIAQHEPYFVDAPNRDNQDAANSIMAIAVHHIEPYEHWKPTLIDAILKYGDRLYTLSLPRAEHQPRLAPHEVLNDFHVTHFNIKTEVTPDVVTGDYKAPEASELNSLRKGLKQFFETENFGVICAKNYCAAVWKANDDKAWVYWDPHPVGPTGKLSPASVAGMVLFSTLDELADTFKTNLNNLERPGTNNYSISSVKAFWKLAESEDAGKIKSLGLGAVADEDYEFKVLTGYVEMARGRTILRGTRITQPLPASQFARDTVIWSAASAVVAVAMANVRRPPLWTVKTVDEIIRHGCSLFTSTLSNIGYEFRPCEDILHPLQLDRKFVLGSTFIRYEIEDVCHGKLEKKTFNEMSAELGLSRFFDKFSLGILWSAPHAVALWRLDRGPPYYMMEPHACGPTGLRTDAKEDAAPCVMTFTSPKLLTYAYLQNLPKSERHKYDYTLFRVRVTVTPIKPWGSGDPPLVRPPPGRPPNYTVIPATSKVGVDGLRRDVVRTVMHDAMCLVPQPTEEEMERLQELLWKGDKDQGLRNSNGWLVLQDGTQFLSASHSIACKRFSAASRGNQDLACCVMAVAQSIILELCRWCVATLDSILDSGDQLYQDSYLHYHPKTKKLNMEQVLRKFYTPGNCVCRVMVFNARQHGSVDEDLDTFVTTLKQFFREENMGVFVAYDGEYAVTLFKNPRGFYLFDPHDCDRYGRAVPPLLTGRARACLSQFASVRCLAEKLKKNIPPPMTKTLNSERAPEMKVMATPEVKNVETSEVRAVETPEVKLVETSEVKPMETSEVKAVETSEAGPSGIPVPQTTRQSSVHFTIPPPGVLKGRYSIYGMKVGSLRKLHAYEK